MIFWLFNPVGGQDCTPSNHCRVISRSSDLFEIAVVHEPSRPNFLNIYTGTFWIDNRSLTILADAWTHIAVTYDSGSRTVRAYANGIEVFSRGGAIINQSGFLFIGKRVNGPGEGYKGLIDEVEFYNRVLAVTEIQAIFNAGSAGKCKVVDTDGDGVFDDLDLCPSTVIPESVPTERLGVNRYALVDGDGVFDTTSPKGKGPRRSFTVEDTDGCSCEQIIDELGLGKGHEKFGCSISAMEEWVSQANQ